MVHYYWESPEGEEAIYESHGEYDFHHGWWFGDRARPCGGAAEPRKSGHHFRPPEISPESSREGESENGLGRTGSSGPREHRLGGEEAHRAVPQAQRPDQQRRNHAN